jgi:hypothetical protein
MAAPCARSAQAKNNAIAIAAGLINGVILVFIGVVLLVSFGKFCLAWQRNAETFFRLTTCGTGFDELCSARLRGEIRMVRSRILKDTGDLAPIFFALFEFVALGFAISRFPLEFSALPFPVL